MSTKQTLNWIIAVAVAASACNAQALDMQLSVYEESEYTTNTARTADDVVIERDGAIVVNDPTSLPFMSGSEIDFVDDLMGQSFQIHNPNATASCGCGTSFSI